jgi:hypothetical protein
MKYYERCKVIVAIPVGDKFDEGVIREALAERLPGIDVSFRPVSSTEVLEVGEVFVPPDHPIARSRGARSRHGRTLKLRPRKDKRGFDLISNALPFPVHATRTCSYERDDGNANRPGYENSTEIRPPSVIVIREAVK